MNEVLMSIGVDPKLHTESHFDLAQLVVKEESEGIIEYALSLKNDKPVVPQPVVVEWSIPAVNVMGVWRNTVDFNKRIEADWELEMQQSRISIDSPVISLFGNDDTNALTFACSNAINRVELAAKYREEDNRFYCKMIFFTECKYHIEEFNANIRLDFRRIHFSHALNDVSIWWENNGMEPMKVPQIAKRPLYSTWYQYHQNLDTELLKRECQIVKELGYDAIILDDGWQTKDSNRGYDYTGDWNPDRIPEISDFVKDLQKIGMKVGLWFSVPFCGRKSQAYKKFKGKFLTENHRWAPVFDPRYPDVRSYLVSIYTKAIRDWGLDGLKLDFIDDFQAYEDTSFESDPNRDFNSINDAVNELLKQVKLAVTAINPEVFIEFRQRYIGPAIRPYGNMLRAFDCPGDPTMNRVRIADIKMLAGNTAVHSDMVKWNYEEPVELASLHMINTLFGVPQLSVLVTDAPSDHIEMIKFYTDYWVRRSEVLMNGEFMPNSPLSNYPLLNAKKNGVGVFTVHEDCPVQIKDQFYQFEIVNGKQSEDLVTIVSNDFGEYHFKILDCKGLEHDRGVMNLAKGPAIWNIPIGGMLVFESLNQ